MKKSFFILAAIFVFTTVKAQDTLKVMSYNLLNYGNITSYCTVQNNSFTDKEKSLRSIINYTRPDIFAVNELAGNSFIHKRLLDSALNGGYANYYAKAGYSNGAGSDIVVMMYYNSKKLSLAGQYILNTQVRDIVLYKLYYNDPALAQTNDTAFINCIVAHLKAGSSSSDISTRASMVENAMSWLSQHAGAGDYLFMGDLNLKSSSEAAYQKLTNYSNASIRFYDPINKPGNWNNHSSFASIHTQSTHSSSNGCASGGGLDDRFDFILASSSVINGTSHYQYIPGSYTVVGNDGQHFNKAINSGANNSAPASVINNLYNMSDHLPLMMKLKVDQQGAGIAAALNRNNLRIKTVSPFDNRLLVKTASAASTNITVELFSAEGRRFYKNEMLLNYGDGEINIETSLLPAGLYILKVTDETGFFISRKVIKL
jgi:endonuclease/exonuclease/phosphatase family metal-dependent hydrolase